MNDQTSERIGAFWNWCFGVKVLLALAFVNLIASLPLWGLAWVVGVLSGSDDPAQSTAATLITVTAALIWYPLAFGWMVHHAPDWFTFRWGRDG